MPLRLSRWIVRQCGRPSFTKYARLVRMNSPVRAFLSQCKNVRDVCVICMYIFWCLFQSSNVGTEVRSYPAASHCPAGTLRIIRLSQEFHCNIYLSRFSSLERHRKRLLSRTTSTIDWNLLSVPDDSQAWKPKYSSSVIIWMRRSHLKFTAIRNQPFQYSGTSTFTIVLMSYRCTNTHHSSLCPILPIKVMHWTPISVSQLCSRYQRWIGLSHGNVAGNVAGIFRFKFPYK